MRGRINIHYGYTYEAAVRLDKGEVLSSSVFLMSTGLTWGRVHDLIARAFHISTDTELTQCANHISAHHSHHWLRIHGLLMVSKGERGMRPQHRRQSPNRHKFLPDSARSCNLVHKSGDWLSHTHNHQPTHSPLILSESVKTRDSGFSPCLMGKQHRGRQVSIPNRVLARPMWSLLIQ